MEKLLNSIKDQLKKYSDIILIEYSIESKNSSKEDLFPIVQLTDSKQLRFNTKYCSWSFNGSSLGDYYRSINALVEDIIGSVTYFIRTSDYKLEDIQEIMISPLIEEIMIMVENDIIKRNDMINNSIILNSKNLFNLFSAIDVLYDSIDKIFNHRQNKFVGLFNDINNTILNYIHYPTQYRRHTLFHQMEPYDTLGSLNFCWSKQRNLIEDIVKFHTLLREGNFIEKETPIDLLKNAFSCSFLKEPLNIKWTKQVKGKSSKALLFHFIDELEHFNYIEITEQNSLLFKKIEYIFCDNKGDKFNNLDVSKSQWLNQRKSGRTPQEIQLDNIMYLVYKSNQ